MTKTKKEELKFTKEDILSLRNVFTKARLQHVSTNPKDTIGLGELINFETKVLKYLSKNGNKSDSTGK